MSILRACEPDFKSVRGNISGHLLFFLPAHFATSGNAAGSASWAAPRRDEVDSWLEMNGHDPIGWNFQE